MVIVVVIAVGETVAWSIAAHNELRNAALLALGATVGISRRGTSKMLKQRGFIENVVSARPTNAYSPLFGDIGVRDSTVLPEHPNITFCKTRGIPLGSLQFARYWMFSVRYAKISSSSNTDVTATCFGTMASAGRARGCPAFFPSDA
ncbi:MAG TPA: hypothetical protein VMO78_00225 [Rhizomicrobium sp.]|nr:hypothetical protein [Rhizomicrobium sp.]